MDEPRQQLLTAREAAEYLRISLATLRRMEKKGHLLPFHTLGGHRRYSRTMLDAYLDRSQRPPLETMPQAAGERVRAEGRGPGRTPV